MAQPDSRRGAASSLGCVHPGSPQDLCLCWFETPTPRARLGLVRHLRHALFGLLMLGSGGALAESSADIRPAPLPSFGAIKYQVLAAAAQQTEQAASLYVGSGASDLLIQRLRLSVDGAAPFEKTFSAAEAEVLAQSDGLLRIDGLALPVDARTLHAEIEALPAEKPESGLQRFSSEHPIETDGPAPLLELALKPSLLWGAPTLQWRAHRVVASVPAAEPAADAGWLARNWQWLADIGSGDDDAQGSDGDPRRRHAAALMALGLYDEAVVALLGLQQGATILPASYWLALSAALHQAQLPDAAALICQRLDAAHQKPQAVAVEWLAVAIEQRRQGDSVAAARSLAAARGRLPEDRELDWQLTEAQLQFDRDRTPEALRALQPGSSEQLDAYRFMDQSVDAVRKANYRRYNLAVALVRSGDAIQGLSLLDLVGRLRGNDSELLALRDQANLALGWQFLRDKQGATAMGILSRVRSEGPAANRALLGMGWAQLEPGGDQQARVRLAESPAAISDPLPAPLRNSLIRLGALEPETLGQKGPRLFSQERPAKTREEALRRALVYWNYLADRDASDPAVQEGLLAVLYAQDSLAEFGPALTTSRRALAGLETSQKDLQARQDKLKSGELLAALDTLPDPSGLNALLADHGLPQSDATRPLQAALERRIALRQLHKRLTPSSVPQTARLLAATEALLTANAGQVQALAQQQYEAQQQQLGRYLEVAYFSAARIEDKANTVK